ncbi:hypothetical protein RLG32_07760, partial [Streptococcus pneumoniae]|nr:hypothetical protein [Streptococcus pneumoniae]MDS6135939.1 hypothetical protein [Streptococcus pneumoniae]
KKHPLGEKRNHPGSKLRQGFWMVFRFGVNNWGRKLVAGCSKYCFEVVDRTDEVSHIYNPR